MKIAVFYNLSFGGAKRTVFEHVKRLSDLGHAVDVYTTDSENDIFDPGKVAKYEYRYAFTPRSFNFPILSRLKHDYDTFFALKFLHRKIAATIDARGYDIVLAHTDTRTQAPFLTQFLKTKNLYFCLEPLRMVYEYSLRIPDDIGIVNKLYETINRSIRKRIDQQNARAATITTAISYFAREYMILAFDLYAEISYLGVDTKNFTPLPIKKKKQVLFIGQKESLNGYEYAKQAMNLIPHTMRPELKVVTLKKSNNERLTEEEVVRLYNESLVTLSLSTFDTFGLIPLESMACEVPVIAFNVAAYRETIIDGKTGFLVDFNAAAIAEKITYLLNNPERANTMGKAGRIWVEKMWTWERQVKQLEKLLQIYTNKESKERLSI